ncbi:RNA methyltransferase [Desulfovibrio sp. OttesenSCG-928-G15]|nr:RNA methyltransferase [Desulfovibrio sp. OttesenSCG-928-G15]
MHGRPDSATGNTSGNTPGNTEDAPLLPGVKPVLELLLESPDRVDAVFLRKGRHGKDMERIIDTCRKEGVRFSLLDGPAFGRIYSGNSQGVVARLFEAGFVDLDDLFTSCPDSPLPLILAFDQIQDPGNAGTLARTLYSLGGTGIITPRHNGVFLGGAASKAAAGAFERLPVAKVANIGQALDKARKLGIAIYGAASAPVARVAQPETAATSPNLPVLPVLDIFTAQFRLPAILLLGSEEHGIRAGLEKRCDFLLSIPMLREFDSLNVAQAGGIIISAMLRHRLEKQPFGSKTKGPL